MRALKGIEEAAELLGVSIWTVRAWERQKELKAVRLGRRVLFEEEELERFVARAKFPGGNLPNREVLAVERVAVPNAIDAEGGDRA